MPKLVNRAKMTTATTGTGTITLGSAVDGYRTFAAAGVADADVVRYVIEDGDAWEIGLGTYSTTGTTLARGSIESSNADNPINLSGNATVFVSAAAADLQELVDFADNFVLPTADGSTGQVLTTNGAGTLSFTTITGYTDADVDAHLNTGTASSGEVLSWTGSDYDWIAAPAALTGATLTFSTKLGVGAGTSETASGGVFVGVNAGKNTTGTNNVAIGYLALESNTTGFSNVAIGKGSARLATGNQNVSVGEESLYSITTGDANSAVGHLSLKSVTTGVENTALGSRSGMAVTTGIQNVLLGYRAGWSGTNDLTTGSNNILLGYNAAASSATVSNEITLGNSSITTLRCQVTTITSLSDERDKTDIQPLNAGLEFVEALNPVSFTWNMRDGGKVGVADTGFIAQDLQKAQADTGVTIPDLVYDVNPDKLEAGYGKLIPVLVQAIKDLSAEVKTLKAQLEVK